MKRLLSISLAVLLAAFIIVSCSPDTKNVENGLAVISFNADDRNTRSLSRTNPVLDAEDFWWSFTAKKTDGTQLVTGQTGTGVENKKNIGEKGLTAAAGAFSYGEWKFTLYGYADAERKNLAYQGSSAVVISDKKTTLSVTVQSQTAGNGSGYLEIPEKGTVTLKRSDKANTAVTVYTDFVEKICIKPVTAIEGQEEVTAYDKENDDGKNVRTFTLKSGSYEVTISYLQGGTLSADKATYTGGYAVGEETIVVTIADYLTTKIGGDISENTGEVTVVAQGEITKATANVSIAENAETLDVEIPAAPAAAAENSESAAEVKTTTVSVPKGLVDGNVSSAKLSVTSYTKEAVAEATPTIEITDSGSDTPTTAVVVGGLDIDLYVNSNTEKTTTFATNQVLTITTYVGTGLNGGSDYTYSTEHPTCGITVKYNGEGKNDGTVQKYVASTGELTFTVDHLSSFYIAVAPAAKNETTGTLYATLGEAISEANVGETIILQDNVTADFSVSSELATAVTIDLNSKTLTLGNSDFNLGNDVTLKNGTLDVSGEVKKLNLKSGTLALERITAESVTFYGISEKSDTATKITPVPEVDDILTMGKTPDDFVILEGAEETQLAKYRGMDLTWQVLDVDSENGRALVISQYILGAMQHAASAYGYKWSASLINTWLNNTTEEGFVAKYGLDNVSMVRVEHETEAGSGGGAAKAETTNEMVFLLSETEAKTYFKTDAERVGRKLNGTAYSEGDAYMWWLRTPKSLTVCAYVNQNGQIKSDNNCTYKWYIRPAFWISLATTLD